MIELLLVDDDPNDRVLAQRALERELQGLRVTQAHDSRTFLEALAASVPDVVITDYQLRWSTGMDILERVLREHPHVPVIMFTNTGTEEVCAEAMKKGLFDYIIKTPHHYARLPAAVVNALRAREVEQHRRERAREREEYRNQLERLLERERAARMEVERASALKDQFLATLSHELRTPLQSILGWAELLGAERVSTERRIHGADVVFRNAEALTQLVEDLLDMSRIVTGRLRLDPERCDLGKLAQDSVASIRERANQKSVEVRAHIDSRAGAVTVDPERMRQIMTNLLENALKFTEPSGRIDVRVDRVGSQVTLEISDTGQGIDSAVLPHIFERFRQADGSTTRRSGGLGLGLSLVKHLTELQGGRVSAESGGIGKGATFTVTFPVAALRGAGDGGGQGRSSRPRLDPSDTLEGLRILCVDDSPDALTLIAELLRHAGAEVVTAPGATEALCILDDAPFDVLVSDLGMPERDGYELIRTLRRRPPSENGGIPAVALTAYGQSSDRRKALEAGFQMHVVKPVDGSEFLTVVANVTGRLSPVAPSDPPGE